MFKKCNTIFCALNWRKQVSNIKLETLQEAKDSGRLEVPNPYFYYLAAQLQHITGWLNLESSDTARNIVTTLLSSDGLGESIEAGELRTLSRYPTLALIEYGEKLNNTSNIWDILVIPIF